MCNNNKLQFECEKCGSNELAYKKYVLCVTPVVVHPDGTVEYLPSTIDEDDYLATQNGYICKTCGSYVDHCGCRMQTEKELITYLSMDPEEREQQKKDYEELLGAQMYGQEQREGEYIIYHEEVSPAEKLALTQPD